MAMLNNQMVNVQINPFFPTIILLFSHYSDKPTIWEWFIPRIYVNYSELLGIV